MPTVSSPAKIDRIRSYGADLTVGGERYAEALAASIEWSQSSGAMPVHAFDQIETMMGQGTLGLELSQQAPELDTVLVAVGGGGLIGGVAAWYASKTRVVAVEPEGAPTLAEALKAGKPVYAPAGSVAADSLAPKRVGELMFPIAQAHIERVVLVTDLAIHMAQRTLWGCGLSPSPAARPHCGGAVRAYRLADGDASASSPRRKYDRGPFRVAASWCVLHRGARAFQASGVRCRSEAQESIQRRPRLDARIRSYRWRSFERISAARRPAASVVTTRAGQLRV